MIHGWRAWLHHASRRRAEVQRLAAGIVIAGLLLAWALCQVEPVPTTEQITVDPVEHALRTEWRRLRDASHPQPRQMCHWLRKLTPSLRMVAEALEYPPADWATYAKEGRVLAYEVRPLLQHHLREQNLIQLAEDYLAACLKSDEAERRDAATQVRAAAEREPPQPHANELHASLLLRADEDAAALAAMMREGTQFPDAAQARETAVRLALLHKDRAALAEMAARGWLRAVPPILEHEAGSLLGDVWLQWCGLLRHRLATLPLAALLLTAMASGLWYGLLVMHTPRQDWRWSWPVAPVVAGIASIWPTVSLIAWQEQEMGIGLSQEPAPFPLDLWHLILGVGLREEICKLALAAFFMPWLLWRRAPGKALMTGAFVGLGFALEENLDYYQSMGGAVALPRFLSANFLHVALTGLATHALYEMLRTRFARADFFLTTLGTVILAHAAYDYQPPGGGGLEIYLPMMILALLAWRFWDEVDLQLPTVGQTLAPGAVLLLGSALLIATSLITTAVQHRDWGRVLEAASACASILPVMLIYWRRFEGGMSAR
ncbi:MAG: PrsW family intramembrane metalloprotease [Prosthecobacter sp.]|nr:PrsW family intramembrane metalloprotease [Prosthecobacter sp.]